MDFGRTRWSWQDSRVAAVRSIIGRCVLAQLGQKDYERQDRRVFEASMLVDFVARSGNLVVGEFDIASGVRLRQGGV